MKKINRKSFFRNAATLAAVTCASLFLPNKSEPQVPKIDFSKTTDLKLANGDGLTVHPIEFAGSPNGTHSRDKVIVSVSGIKPDEHIVCEITGTDGVHEHVMEKIILTNDNPTYVTQFYFEKKSVMTMFTHSMGWV